MTCGVRTTLDRTTSPGDLNAVGSQLPSDHDPRFLDSALRGKFGEGKDRIAGEACAARRGFRPCLFVFVRLMTALWTDRRPTEETAETAIPTLQFRVCRPCR